MSAENFTPDWKQDSWWELQDGWRVCNKPTSKHFGCCWNIYTGEETDFTSLRIALYGETLAGLEALITKAIAHGKNE